MSDALPRAALDGLLAAFPGRAGVEVRDLSTGESYAHDAHRRFPPASVMKVAVMVELFHQAAAGRVSLDDRHTIHDGLCRHGTRTEVTAVGTTWSLRDLARLMIAQSDNVATDLVLEIIGVAPINQTMDALGLTDTRVGMSMGRWHYLIVGLGDAPINPENDEEMNARARSKRIDFDGPGYADTPANNLASAHDAAEILTRLHAGTLVSAEASAQMLDLLRACDNRSMIPHHLDPHVPVAHKIGVSSHLRADVGIVELPGRPVIIAALTYAANQGDLKPGPILIGDIARTVVKGNEK